MKRFLTFLVGFTGVITAFAGISYTAGTVDFGNIIEEDGLKTVRIYVRNDSTTPSALLKVRPSCGCTAADFMKEEFAPGDSAWIDLTYNPYRRPGSFEKTVRVYPVEGDMIRIPITGVVFASPETIENMFPVEAGLLHLSEKTLMPVRPLSIESKNLYVDVYNSGNETVYPRIICDSEAVEAQCFPAVIPPGEKGMIGVYLNPLKESRTGNIEYTLRLYTSLSPDAEETSSPFELKVVTNKE